jgi:hypothetical protein
LTWTSTFKAIGWKPGLINECKYNDIEALAVLVFFKANSMVYSIDAKSLSTKVKNGDVKMTR